MTLSKVVGDLQLGGVSSHGLNHLVGASTRRSFGCACICLSEAERRCDRRWLCNARSKEMIVYEKLERETNLGLVSGCFWIFVSSGNLVSQKKFSALGHLPKSTFKLSSSKKQKTRKTIRHM